MVGAAREVQRVLRVITVLERGEQVEPPLERVAIARLEGSLELGVARHAPGSPLLTQKNGLEGLADVPAVLPHRRKSRDHGREELVQAIRGDVACRTTEEIALDGAQDGDEVIVRERAVTIVLEEGHEQRVHCGHVKCPNAGEKNVELLVLAGAGRDAGIVLRIAANLLEEVCHLSGFVVNVVGHVTLEQAVHVASGDACRSVDDREPVAEELVEDLVIAVGTERLLNCAPVVGVEVLLLVHGKSHEYEVAHKVRCREVLSRGVHRLKDELRVVLPLRKGDRHNLEALDAVPDHVGNVDVVQPRAEEREVVDDSVALIHDLDIRNL